MSPYPITVLGPNEILKKHVNVKNRLPISVFCKIRTELYKKNVELSGLCTYCLLYFLSACKIGQKDPSTFNLN